ncbi:BAG family molecular chaperone regulator 1B [Cytospora mali]|uniref:BAG family molecular chaperone regulator 1B n=1 Tax=Cytospora mali TaxID=578113 RepID=A0A194VJ43_CYTMA|nr:BAG family molecular chaperone regulator 1B [Valsa mali]
MRPPEQLPKVASGLLSTLASSGAASRIAGHIAKFTSSLVKQLPPSVQTFLGSASQYIQSTIGVAPTVFYTSAALAAVLLGVIPTAYARSSKGKDGKRKMSRYGWSSGPGRGALSPFNSGLGPEGVPPVTDDDYSYITSEDLENHGVEEEYRREPVDRSRHYTRSGGGPSLVIDEDDILLIKSKGITYPEHFPAYSIGDGKLLVGDVRERAQMVMKLSDRKYRKTKLLYKGRQLKDDEEPICSYGVKNNSEILVVLPEGADDDSSTASEEVVVVGSKDEEGRSKKSKSGKKRKSKKKERNSSSTSPRDSGLEVPGISAATTSRPQSPASGVSGASAAAVVPGGPIDKLNGIKSHFATKLLPLCVQYTANPPTDPKKKEDEHRKLSETLMQQVLLKLDEVQTNGEEEARMKRKELVQLVQDVLKNLDDAKAA